MGFPLSFFFIIELNKKKLQILLQDKYNTGVLTVNMEFMCDLIGRLFLGNLLTPVYYQELKVRVAHGLKV